MPGGVISVAVSMIPIFIANTVIQENSSDFQSFFLQTTELTLNGPLFEQTLLMPLDLKQGANLKTVPCG